MSGPLLGPEQVAERLGVSPRAIRKWAHEKRIPHIRFGKLYRFTEADIDEILELHRARMIRFVRKAA